MSDFHMFLCRESVGAGQTTTVAGQFSVLWPLSGSLQAGGLRCDSGEAVLVEGPVSVDGLGDSVSWLRFVLDPAAPDPKGAGGAEVLLSRQIELADGRVLLRLDQVSFPPGAVAWRHVHPGPGIRHLIKGRLHLQADDHERQTQAGDSWFEAANSPVRATAGSDEAETAFVRFMALPVAYQGKPTIQILDDADAARPRLQSTQRYIDQIVALPQG